LDTVRKKLDVAENNYSEISSRETARRGQLVDRGAQCRKAEDQQKRIADEIRELESQRKLLLEKNGDEAARTGKIEEAKKNLSLEEEEEKAERENLKKLGADTLRLEFEQLEKAIGSTRQNLTEARDRRTRAQTELSRSGSRDPESDLKEIEARLERSEARLAGRQRQAEIRLNLLDRLKAARQETNAALAQPLEAAIAPYLRILFGTGTPKLTWSEDGSRLEQIALDRTEAKADLFPFEELSHGTREQVALALRLAMAELLAAHHDGQLPLVLDDAFTHADPERIQKLNTLLYQASQQGLQILLLSCHPEHYSALGGKEVRVG